MIFEVGIIGTGVIGQRLASVFSENPDIKINSICDLDMSLAKSLASKYDRKVALDHKELLSIEDIDIIYVGMDSYAY